MCVCVACVYASQRCALCHGSLRCREINAYIGLFLCTWGSPQIKCSWCILSIFLVFRYGLPLKVQCTTCRSANVNVAIINQLCKFRRYHKEFRVNKQNITLARKPMLPTQNWSRPSNHHETAWKISTSPSVSGWHSSGSGVVLEKFVSMIGMSESANKRLKET